MAKKNLAEVLQTDVMTNLPTAALAQIVRSKGRGRDTILAHITPREAKKLKREGGRGSINPDTGLPEFDDGFFFDPTPVASQGFDFQAPSYTPEMVTQPITQAPAQDYSFQSTPQSGFQQPYQAADYTNTFQPFTGGESYAGAFPGQYAGGGPLSGNAVDARTLFVPRPDVPVEAKTDVRVPQLTAADIAAQRGYTVSPEGVETATTPEGERTLEDEQLRQYREQVAAEAEAKGDTPPKAPPVAGGAGGGAGGSAGGSAGGAQSAPKISDIVTAVGLDVGKLSTADMSRLNQIQSLVANGTMTVEQAQTAIAELAKSQTFTGGLTKWASDPGNALKLALGLGAGAMGMLNMSNAKKQAANVQAQMNNLAGQYKTMAQPFLQQGGQQFGLAAQGALTQAGQQQFDVARAQLAQAAAKTGSVGAMQATQIAEQMRQNAINNQMTQGLQVLAAGNSQMGQALQTEMQALNQGIALSNQAGQAATNFYTQLAALFGGVKG